jgi:PD-(D/E)XK nuclease superfamily
MARVVSSSFIKKLISVAGSPSPAFIKLDAAWHTLSKQLKAERAELESRIKLDDPLRLRVDLLTPLGRQLSETSHTRALAFLLDPLGSHGMGKKPLLALLKALGTNPYAKRIATLLAQTSPRFVSVRPEYYFLESANYAGRCDIRIELRGQRRRALIIIENKIDASEGRDQLRWYEKHASEWEKHNKGAVLLLYICRPLGMRGERRGPTSGRWSVVDHALLASVLGNLWRGQKTATGANWLSLYVATLVHGVLGLRFDDSQASSELLASYLGKK